jgi:hypothetical protein
MSLQMVYKMTFAKWQSRHYHLIITAATIIDPNRVFTKVEKKRFASDGKGIASPLREQLAITRKEKVCGKLSDCAFFQNLVDSCCVR